MVQPDSKRLVTVAEEAADNVADRLYVDQAIATALANLPGGSSTSQANAIYMPIWDGTGTQPVRPANSSGYVVVWRQPVAPPMDATHAKAGDHVKLT